MRQAFSLLLAICCVAVPTFAQTPDFGPNVLILTPSTPSDVAQIAINTIYARQQRNEFGPERNAILLMPGDYHLNIPIGFYTQVLGLGARPDDTHITGDVHVDASRSNNNATTTFWRGAENFSVTPQGGDKPGAVQWAVSQAIPFRRMHVMGDLTLHQHGGWASGGWMSDSLIDGKVDSGPQQQWISRNSQWASWTGSNWNMVFVGVPHPPEGAWPKPAYTEVAQTPIVREKPYLEVDGTNHWWVRVPPLRVDSSGISWGKGDKPDPRISLDKFYIAHALTDTASTINAQLAQGKHLLLTPGIYDLTESLRISHPHTVVLGLGFATLHPIRGTPAMTTADVDGITIAGLLFDAGPMKSPMLLEIGPQGSKLSHQKYPTSLFDVFFRVGGAGPGKTASNLTINAADTIVDHTWIWRADHGVDVGWDDNLSDNGLIVNADRVTVYGLFVEHHQQYQVLWNGNEGRTYFYQSEIPYDPPTQAVYTSAPAVDGWASYKIADGVKQHEAWGLGVYSVFRHPDIFLTRAIEVPEVPSIRFHDMVTVCLDTNGGIRNVINDVGGSTKCGPHRVEPKVTLFPDPAQR